MTTTIKVSDEVRDRLKAQAALSQRTLGQHLAYLAELADRDTRLSSVRDAIAAMSPRQRKSYVAESTAWDRIASGDPADAT